jgi:hypothetical protein
VWWSPSLESRNPSAGDACLRSTSSSNFSSTLPSHFRTDQPRASTVVHAAAAITVTMGSIGTTTATPITATGGAPRRQRAPMRCKTPGYDGCGSTRPDRFRHCSMRCCPRRHLQTQVVSLAHGCIRVITLHHCKCVYIYMLLLLLLLVLQVLLGKETAW